MEKNIGTINAELKDMAIAHGLCDQWQNEWRYVDWNLDYLVRRYFKGIDFCFKHNYPTLDYFEETFDKDELCKRGIAVSTKHSFLNPGHCALLGNSDANVRVNAYNVSSIWAKDNSKMHLFASGHACAHVHIFNNVEVFAHTDDFGDIKIFKHSPDCKVSIDGSSNVTVIEEFGYLQN